MSFQIFSFGQRRFPQELQKRLQGKTILAEIMSEVNQYYDFGKANITREPGEDEFESNDYEWWKKWEYWAKRHLDANGRLADAKTLNYLAKLEVEAKFSKELNDAADYFNNLSPRSDLSENSLQAPPGDNGEPANLSYGGWTSLGPTSGGTIVGSGTNIDLNGLGRIDRIAFHPTNANIFYVCSPSGSLYRTTNGGTSWVDVGEGLPGGISCVEVARSNGNVVYAFSGDGDSHIPNALVFTTGNSPISRGVFRSINAGATWVKVSDMYTGSNDLVGRNMAISEDNSNYLFAATDQGLYRTTNGGTSWALVKTGNFYDVEFRPYNDNSIYASTATSVVYSTDGGDTWTNSTFDFSVAANRIELGVRRNNTNASSNFVYALAGDAFTGSFQGLFLSTDAGVSFTRQSNSPNIFGSETDGSDGTDQTIYDLGICVKPDNVAKIATAGLCVWRSINSGTTMTYSTTSREGKGPPSAYIHPDVHDVEYNPVDNILYACSDGGVYKSTDDGVTWTDISSGLTTTQFYHMAMRDSDGDGYMNGINFLGGAQDNGVKYRTGTGAYRHLVCCDGFGVMINGNDADWLVMNINNSLYQTPNGGTTMNFRGSVSFFSPMAVDHDFGDTMYVASSGGLQRSYDGFLTSTTLAFDLNNLIVTCPSNNARLYGSSGASVNLRISNDRGDNWTTISGNTGWPSGTPVVTDCKPSPTNSSTIYASFGGYIAGTKVFRSTDAGLTWNNYSGSLPNMPVHSCAVAAEGVYIGTEIGVFFRAAGSSDWTPFYTGMPRVIVSDLWVNNNGLVYASTFGRGVWFASRYSACVSDITVAGNLTGPNYFEAGSTATVTANSNAGSGTDIYVKSNGYVDLKEGFEIRTGTFFSAYLGPCSSGIPASSFIDNGGNDPNLNMIEYDDKAMAGKPVSASAYYVLASDGVEVFIPKDALIDVQVEETGTGQIKKLVASRWMSKGMYKIITGAGNFVVKVKANGQPVKLR